MLRTISPAALSALLTLPLFAQTVLWDNGPFETGTNGGGERISAFSAGYDSFGIVCSGYATAPQRIADNFRITNGAWDLSSMTVYAYQSGQTNPFTQAYVAIFDADPTGTPNLAPKYGSLDPATAPNRLLSQTYTGVIRTDASGVTSAGRRIHAVSLDLSWVPDDLPPGEYYMAVGLRGTTAAATVAVVPVTPVPANSDGLVYGRIRYTPPGRENFWQYADGNITPPDPTVFETYDHAFTVSGNLVSTNEWSKTSGGAYADTANWSQSSVPNATDAAANFLSAITADGTVTLGSATVGKLNFNNSHRYTLDGGTLTLQQTTSAQINVFAGSHTIASPLALNSNVTCLVVNAADSLTISQPVVAADRSVTHKGAGKTIVKRLDVGTLAVRQGTLAIQGSPLQGSVTRSLIVQSGARLDLGSSLLAVDYTDTSPVASIGSLLVSGAASGSWNGTGIMSGVAAANSATSTRTAIAMAEATELFGASASFPVSFNGLSVDATSIVLMHTLTGDANFDRKVDTVDFNSLAGNYGTATTWFAGNFNYDAAIDSLDFDLLVANFGKTLAVASSPLGATVPEPAIAVGMLLPLLCVRRNRRQ